MASRGRGFRFGEGNPKSACITIGCATTDISLLRSSKSVREPGVMCNQEGEQILSFSDMYMKSKNKLLGSSGVCLFVGVTEALPQKISLIGLDLSGKPEIFGWFLLAFTCYFLINSIVLSVLDLIKYCLPYLIFKKGDKVTGGAIGLTEDECQRENFEHYFEQPEFGTNHSELRDIQRQRKVIEDNLNSRYIKLVNTTKLLFDLFFPIVFSAISIFRLVGFLW